MKREGVFRLFWILAVLAVAGMSYWAGHKQLFSTKAMEEMQDVQIVQSLTPAQRKLLETHPVHVTKGLVVTVQEPGKPPQHFTGLAMSTKMGSGNNAAKLKIKLPKYYPKPCRVRDSKGRLVWGVCFTCRLDK